MYLTFKFSRRCLPRSRRLQITWRRLGEVAASTTLAAGETFNFAQNCLRG